MGLKNFFKGIFGMNSSTVPAALQATYTNPRATYMPPRPTYTVPAQTYSAPQNAAASSSSSGSVGGGNWFDQIDNNIVDHANHDLTVYDPNKNPVVFKPNDILASGGEGTVYDLPMFQGKYVAKIFKPETLNKQEKMKDIRARISDMLQLEKNNGLGQCKWLAWPRMALFNAKGEVIGYLMNKVTGVSFRSLGGGPAQVTKCFPRWDRMKLYQTALDFVKKIKKLADNGIYVNDFNPNNFLVDAQCEVAFIDCDSFQIPSSKGGVHTTGTYFASMVAPELLNNKSLLAKPRTIEQVNFGTALIVYHLLMMGLHPYSYAVRGRKSACGTPDENLRNGRCPLGIGAGCWFPQGNWYNLWSHFTGDLKGCFITTFQRDQGHSNPKQRTTLIQWKDNLDKMIYTAKKDSLRCDLNPMAAKPRGDKQPDISF